MLMDIIQPSNKHLSILTLELLNTIYQEIVHTIFEVYKYCICINQTFQNFSMTVNIE